MSGGEQVGPVGRLYELVAGEHRAVVSESGATLRVYEVAGQAVIEPFDGPDTEPVGCQGQILAPWPNRIVDGRWTWESTPQQLWITEPARGHALHGLVRTLAWTPAGPPAPGGITLAATLLAHPGWPFPLAFTVTYALGPEGLSSQLTATNIGRSACPYGAAVHPYLALGGGAGRVDEAVLDLPAATWVATDDRLAPVGRRPTGRGPYRFDGTANIGDRQVDNAFTDLERGPDGRVEATVTTPDGRRVVVWGDETVAWWQVFTGDDLPDRYRRRTLAVEPMTCAPDALNSGDGLVILQPGQRHALRWGVRPDSWPLPGRSDP